MQKTVNYGLNKPEYNNVADVYPAVCDNMDIIDKSMKDISDAQSNIYITTNVGNNYSVAITNLSTLRDGYPIRVKFNAASTGAITINLSNLGAKAVVDYFGKPVTNVRKDLIANLAYDVTNGNFQLLGKGGGGTATADKILKDETATVDSGPVVGTIPSKAAQTYIPGTTNQIIAAGQYIKEPQIILGDPNLIPDNIPLNKTIFGVKGNAPMFKHEKLNFLYTYNYSQSNFRDMTLQLLGTPVIILFRVISNGNPDPVDQCMVMPKYGVVFSLNWRILQNKDYSVGDNGDGTYSFIVCFDQTYNDKYFKYDSKTSKVTVSDWGQYGTPLEIEYYYLPN